MLGYSEISDFELRMTYQSRLHLTWEYAVYHEFVSSDDPRRTWALTKYIWELSSDAFVYDTVPFFGKDSQINPLNTEISTGHIRSRAYD